MKRLRLHNSAGDTIIEVLIVLAVLGLAFAISTATATRGLRQSRNAEEHSQALGILSSQVELVRVGVDKGTITATDPLDGKPFCMNGTSIGKAATWNAVSSDATSDDFSKYPKTPADPVSCVQNDRYYQSITRNGDDFELRVRWDGLGDLGRQQEIFSYRVHKLEKTNNNIVTGASSPQITVKVKRIAPIVIAGLSFTPPCTNPANTDPVGSSSVRIQQTLGGSYAETRSTEAGSATTFDAENTNGNVVDNTDFNVSILAPPAVAAPLGYQICPNPPTTQPVQLRPPSNNTPTVTFTIRPICTLTPIYVPQQNIPQPPGWGPIASWPVYFWSHEGPDGRHLGWPTYTHDRWEGLPVHYVFRGDLGYNNAAGWFYERWPQRYWIYVLYGSIPQPDIIIPAYTYYVSDCPS